MNEFYSISNLDTKPIDEYQIENLGLERVTMSGAYRQSRNSYDNSPNKTWNISQKVKSSDYDSAFALKIARVNPPYHLENLVNYHLKYYTDKGGDKNTFLKHIQYVVLVHMKKYYDKYPAHIELLEKWLLEDTKTKNRMETNLTANNSIVNIAGGNIHQSGVTINVSDNKYKELKELGVEETHIDELKEIVADKSQDKPTFKSRILKWLSAVTVSVAAKGLIDNLPKLQEFAHHLIP